MTSADTLLSSGDDRLTGGYGDETFEHLWRRTLRITAAALVVWCGLNLVLPATDGMPSLFFRTDVIWLVVAAVLLTALSRWPASFALSDSRIAAMCRPRWLECALVVGATSIILIGTRVVYQGYALSRDEAMARFDAAILFRGQLLANVPLQWRAFANALEPRFVLPVPGNTAWVSSYLPGNAAIRALLDVPFGVGLASPFLVALSIVATIGVARQIWPDRRDAAVVAGVLLVTSTQLIVTAFTPYAMTAHLALDTLWLWFFLRGRVWSHFGAIVTGAVACGLHQIIFHPLFVAPFILQLWLGRRWRLAAIYTGAYAAIGLFWVLYWQILLTGYGLHGIEGAHGIAMFYAEVAGLLGAFDWFGLELMGKNITRFLAWQNPFVLPMAFVAFASLRRFEGPVAALAAGFALTLVAMFIILPFQGLGWGYRYVHGLLGSLALLGAQGWVLTTSSGGEGANRLWSQLGAASLFSLFVMLPARVFEVEALVWPFSAASQAINAARADIVVIDRNGMPFSQDLVRNDPFLRNRPLVMDLSGLDAPGIRALCANHTIAIFDHQEWATFHLPEGEPHDENSLRPLMRALSCGYHLKASDAH